MNAKAVGMLVGMAVACSSGATLLLVSPGSVAASDDKVLEVLRTKRVEVVDTEGRTRVEIGHTMDGFGLTVIGGKEHGGSMSVSVQDHGTHSLSMRTGGGGLNIFASPSGGVQMIVTDKDGEYRILARVFPGGSVTLGVNSKDGPAVLKGVKLEERK